MNIKKLFTTLTLTLTMVIGIGATVFATPEGDIIKALKDANIPSSYIIQAENYLKSNSVTVAEATAIITKVKEADAIMTAAGVTDPAKLSDADVQKITTSIKDAGNVIGLSINLARTSTGGVNVTAKDSAGVTVISFTSKDVKQTGLNSSMLFAGALLIFMAAGSVVVLKKKITA